MKAQSVILPASASREDAISRLLEVAMSLPEGRPWRFTWETAKAERTDLQNNALWGVAYKFLRDETGNDPEDLHQYFCGEYFGWVETTVLGRRKLRPRRTTTTDEHGHRDVIARMHFSDFYAFIQQRVAETLGLVVPDPDPLWFERAA